MTTVHGKSSVVDWKKYAKKKDGAKFKDKEAAPLNAHATKRRRPATRLHPSPKAPRAQCKGSGAPGDSYSYTTQISVSVTKSGSARVGRSDAK